MGAKVVRGTFIFRDDHRGHIGLINIYFVGKLMNAKKDEAWQPQKKDIE